ncbi:hypothetical protein HK097_004749 [Rhizophlyctis rosea]|uniref:Uncharacterized protein n=1 Tax=Rhizophlyctis rosea TaxID=64517 RepID=A0AAD5S0U3_9FUNG|nr:hypothetical protein HK097_004749 [Rhizophlyctis rosea]
MSSTTTTPITTLAHKNIETLRKHYIEFLTNNPPTSRTHTSLESLGAHFSPSVSYIYFFGEIQKTRQGLIQAQKAMGDTCPPMEQRVEEEEFDVLWEGDKGDATLVRVKESWWTGEKKLVIWGTYFYVRDGSAPEGVRVVSYQETNVAKETTMEFGPSAGVPEDGGSA